LIHDPLTQALRSFAGTDFAQAAWSRTLPPDFSRSKLIADLAEIRAGLPKNLANARMFDLPDSLTASPDGVRAREWERSRSALVAAFRGLAEAGIDYRHLGNAVHASLSHTGDAALAIVVFSRDFRAFGVDLEPVSRSVSDAAFARFHRREELSILANRLDHWVLKEAAYKCHPHSSETVIADYFIAARSNDGSYLLRCEKGDRIDFRGILGVHEEFRYALACAT
jgi:phosphopantetheinyl transferase (holo-ACP synthase)